jgi:hypothetical protein
LRHVQQHSDAVGGVDWEVSVDSTIAPCPHRRAANGRGAQGYFGAIAASTCALTRVRPSLAVTIPSQISFRLFPR